MYYILKKLDEDTNCFNLCCIFCVEYIAKCCSKKKKTLSKFLLKISIFNRFDLKLMFSVVSLLYLISEIRVFKKNKPKKSSIILFKSYTKHICLVKTKIISKMTIWWKDMRKFLNKTSLIKGMHPCMSLKKSQKALPYRLKSPFAS